jgi:hypothetical protein
MSDDQQHNLELRIVRLETIIGDADAGMVADIHGIKAQIDNLRAFQWKLFGAFSVIPVVAQLIIQVMFKR